MKKSARKKVAEKRLAEINIGKRKRNKSVPKIEKQELHCHACDRYVQFEIDTSLNGNHTIKCPNCGHEHYRVVKDGIITAERWQSSGASYAVIATSFTVMSTWDSYGNSSAGAEVSYFAYGAWVNSTLATT